MWEISPLLSLSIFTIVILLLALVLLPKIGLNARYKKKKSNTKRVLMEDTLKHLYDYEQNNLQATLNSIAGNSNTSVDKSSKIVESLKKLNLVVLINQSLELTEEGKNYALRIVRIHRLWENYLAEETGVEELDWHDEAEKVEHLLSREEADSLAAQMGNPKFDPHGDPIPTTDGRVFTQKGELLINVKRGEVAKIIHVEDEPKSIYTNLVDKGLHLGKEVFVIDKTSDAILIASDGKEQMLSHLMASKVLVEILTDKKFENIKERTLLDLRSGESGEVLSVAHTCRGQQRRRLLDFGIVPGAIVSIHMKSPLNDPIAYLVKDTIVALRKNQANKVLIKS